MCVSSQTLFLVSVLCPLCPQELYLFREYYYMYIRCFSVCLWTPP